MNRAERRQAAKRQAIEAAMSVADEVADGRLDPAAVEAAAVEACRTLFGQVVGPGDALWELQVETARGVLAHDGIPYAELAEWLGVHRGRPQEPAVEAEDGQR